MRIEHPTIDETDPIADLWIDLARSQRDHGSHLAADENRDRIRESIGRHIMADELLVARIDDVIDGFVMFSLEQRLYQLVVTRGTIHNLYVRSDSRSEGIGSALLDAAETRLVEAGADVIRLEALAANEAAHRFYRRNGYDLHRVEFEKRVETDNTTR